MDSARLRELERAERKLSALEAGGVDNWDGYDFAMEEIQREEDIEEAKDCFIMDLHEELAEAKIDEPAGPGCGYSIDFNEESVRSLLEKLIRDVQEAQAK